MEVDHDASMGNPYPTPDSAPAQDQQVPAMSTTASLTSMYHGNRENAGLPHS